MMLTVVVRMELEDLQRAKRPVYVLAAYQMLGVVAGVMMIKWLYTHTPDLDSQAPLVSLKIWNIQYTHTKQSIIIALTILDS